MDYDFKLIEDKWQKYWEENKIYKTSNNPRNKHYILEMFAYPSGDIHIGHFRNYSVGDAISRFKMMKGLEVLHCFGWDAFGLPAENAAIKRGVHPRDWTMNNIDVSRATLKRVGISYDWDREIATCLPDYYKWTQWMFLQLFKKGLAYRAMSLVNWCNTCKTVLANEQAEDGRCWRCGEVVDKKEMKQWFFKITDYAEKLLLGLEKLEKWPTNVKTMQKNWIGKSEGIEIDFKIDGINEPITVFTTRPDTLFGVTFMAIAPETPLLQKILHNSPNRDEIENYIKNARLKSDIDRTSIGEKDGINTGFYAVNPLSGDKIQLWVADYVLANYATGIVMGVPGHDDRDFQFARKYDIPIKIVIKPRDRDLVVSQMEKAYIEPGVMVNSLEFNGLNSERGLVAISDAICAKKLGRRKVNYKLRDWLISRQRYWGAPIPIIHCECCGTVSVPEKDLPVLLPDDVVKFIPEGRSPLEDSAGFINTTCPKCQKPAKRDPDTMDTFVCSSWYHLRYPDAKNNVEFCNKENRDKWLPVDLYIGGVEHACGHLIYFRFFQQFLYDQGLVPCSEPAVRLFNHGMVLDETGEIMSKSKGNAVSPADLMDRYGTDISRLAMFFAAPSEKEILWSENGLKGIARFVKRFFGFYSEGIGQGFNPPEKIDIDKLNSEEKNLYIHFNRTLKRVDEYMEDMHFNTVVSSLMELLNVVSDFKEKGSPVYKFVIRCLALMVAPLAPHLAEEVWGMMGYKSSIFHAKWPKYDENGISFDEITLVVQINGKLRDRITICSDLDDEKIKETALKSPQIVTAINGKEVKKIIQVGKKLINIVI